MTDQTNTLISFDALPLGARFRYPNAEQVWTVISKERKAMNQPMDGVIAQWEPDMLSYGLWTGQSICAHISGVCPEMVIGVN